MFYVKYFPACLCCRSCDASRSVLKIVLIVLYIVSGTKLNVKLKSEKALRKAISENVAVLTSTCDFLPTGKLSSLQILHARKGLKNACRVILTCENQISLQKHGTTFYQTLINDTKKWCFVSFHRRRWIARKW